MFRNRKEPIHIRVALDSIIYAPLYYFVQQNSLKPKPKFRFYIEPVHKGIKLAPRPNLRSSLSVFANLSSLRPIDDDPVFSPVCDRNFFDYGPRTWFGIGDPLRVWRLYLYRNSAISYRFLGTLVGKLAFWILTERKCQVIPESLKDFNYVTCHSKGMTGYYVTEVLFKTECNNPLAPVYAPGREVDQVLDFLSKDWPRRMDEDTDPVWAAAVSTEIGRILTLQQFLHKQKHLTEIHSLHTENRLGELLPAEFLQTALVARSDANNAKEIEDSADYLKNGIIDAIKGLRKCPEGFCRVVAQFYRSHASFAIPFKTTRPFLLERQMMHPLIARELQDLYPAEQLLAPKLAMLGTECLLLQAILHDVQQKAEGDVLSAYELLRPNAWGAEGTLWAAA